MFLSSLIKVRHYLLEDRSPGNSKLTYGELCRWRCSASFPRRGSSSAGCTTCSYEPEARCPLPARLHSAPTLGLRLPPRLVCARRIPSTFRSCKHEVIVASRNTPRKTLVSRQPNVRPRTTDSSTSEQLKKHISPLRERRLFVYARTEKRFPIAYVPRQQSLPLFLSWRGEARLVRSSSSNSKQQHHCFGRPTSILDLS